jgi:hypothetical protein
MWTTDNFKVFSASVLGFGAPSTNWILDIGEPVLKVLVLFGQFGVAVATIVYISLKCRSVAKSIRRKK